MAVYNPYDSVDSYYNPYENTQQPTGQGLGNIIFSAAKNMAVFGLLNIAGRAATSFLGKAASGAAARAIKKYGKGSLSQTARRVEATSLGQIFRATSSGNQLRQLYSQLSSPFRTALNTKDAYVAQVARTTQSTSAAKIASFKSSFKDVRTFAGSVGRMWKNTVLTGAGVAYAIDSFAGVVGDYGIEPKPWYDIPGQIGNFGKWLAMDSIFSMGFGAATRIAGLAGAKTIRSVADTFKGPLGRSIGKSLSQLSPGIPIGINNQNIFKREILERPHSNQQMGFVSKVINNGLAFGRTVPEAMRTLNDIIRDKATLFKQAWSEAPTMPIRALKKAAGTDPVRGALKQIKDIWHRAHENRKSLSPVEHAGLSVLQFTDDLANKAHGNIGTVKTAHITLGSITEQLAQVSNASRNKRVLADEIFPEMDRLKNKDVVSREWTRDVLGKLSNAFGKAEARKYMRTVLNMRSGIRLYKVRGSDIKGGGVDLGFLDPLYMSRKVLNSVLSKPFKVPFTEWDMRFSDLIQTHTVFGQEPSFDFFKGRQDFAIGKNAKGLNFELDRGKVLTTSEIDKEAWFTIYINGNVTTIGPGGLYTIDTGKNIRATFPNSNFRQAEKYRVEQAMRERGDYVKSYDPPSRLSGNKYLDFFIDKSGLKLPELARKLWNRVSGAIAGKNHQYKEALGSAFTLNPNDWYKSGDSILAVQQALGQDLSQVFKHKELHTLIMGRMSRASHSGDSFDSLISARDIRQRMADLEFELGDNWIEWINKRGIAEEVGLIKADPTAAEQHFIHKRVGNRPAMTAYDKVRVAILENAIIDRFGSGDGLTHPLADAIPTLLEKGIIDKNHAKKLELWGKLTVLTNTGMYDNRNASAEVIEAGQRILRHANEKNWQLERQILDYVSSSELRNTSARRNNIDRYVTSSYFKNTTAYASIDKHPLGFIKAYTENIFENVTNMLHDTIFPFRKDPTKHFSIGGNLGYLFGSIGKIAAAGFAYKALDTFAATNPLFDDTAFDDGLSSFMADNIARLRLGQSRVFDALGITGVAKYLNGLMPGFVTSAPGAIIGGVVSRTLSGGPLSMLKGFAFGAIGNRLLAPYLPDFTKSYDQLEAEYKGEVEVPIMKSPTWLLGTTPYEGSKVIGYQPNWYVRTKSRWKETDTLYGSALRKLMHEPLPFLGISIGDFIDPFYMERKNFFSRPYPETGEWGREIPLVGPLIAGTLGRIFKPKKTMHQEFLTGPEDLSGDSTYPFAIQPPTVQEGRGMMYHSMGLRKMGGRSSLMGTYVYGGESKMWAHAAGEDFLHNIQQFAGLPGFLGGTAKDKLVGAPLVIPTLETAGRMASMSRSYYDMNLGGMGGFCLPEYEKVLTPGGLVQIKDIEKGQVVYDNLFNKKRILNTYSRICLKGERLYTIAIGAGNIQISLTGNHPIAIYKKNQCLNNSCRPCIPGYSNKCKNCSRQDNAIVWNWLPVESVTMGDFVCMPLPEQSRQIIDLGQFAPNYGSTDEYIYFGTSQFGKAYELLEKKIVSTTEELRFYVEDEYAKEAFHSYKQKLKVRRMKRFYEIDEDMAYFLGWWLAKGSSHNKTIKFTLNIEEKHLAKKLGLIYKNKFGGKYFIKECPKFNTCILQLNNLPLALYLKSYGNVYTKHLKDLIYLEDKAAIKLCEALIKGNGWINALLSCGGFISVSPKLVRDLWILLYRLGVQNTITIDYLERVKSPYLQRTNRKNITRSYLKFSKSGFNNLIKIFNNGVSNGPISTDTVFTTDKMLFIKITDISSIDYSGKTVYDIEVEDSHCFIGNYALLHNSEPIRRIIEKPDYRKYGINPIPNMMPNWLPQEFLIGDPYCLSGDTYIEVNKNNIIRIDQYQDELITTHKGNYKKPVAFKSRTMDVNEKLFKIKVSSLSAFPIKATEDHPLWTTTGWKKVIDIQVGEYVGFPIPNITDLTIDVDVLDIAQFTALPRDSRYVYSFGEDQEFVDMIEYIETTQSTFKIENLKHILNQKKWKRSKFERAQALVLNGITQRVPRFIKVTEKLGDLIGYYLSEGFITYSSNKRKGIGFAFNSNEIEYHTEVETSIFSLFGIKCAKRIKNNSCIIFASNKVISDVFSNMFGEDYAKKELKNIPTLVIRRVLRSLFNGSGSYFFDNNKPRLSLKMENSQLLYQVRKILLAMGFIGYINGNNLILRGQSAKNCALYLNTKYKETKDSSYTYRHTFIKDNYVWMRVFDKIEIPQEIVYGMEILDDNSFCTAGVATHNSKIIRGELRLPGSAYAATHKVKKTMPARASMFGAPEEHMMQYFTGLLPPLLKEEYDILETGTTMHEKIQDHLAAEGLLIQAEALVYDVKNDISGHVDAIIRDGTGGRGRRALEIKSINQAAFDKLDAPKYQHVGQLNFYLKQLKMQEGTILYVSRENPSQIKTFNIKYSESRWQSDLRKLQKVRQNVADIGDKLNDRFGYSYSWVDRLYILADVAPMSNEYKEAKMLVEKQIKHGILDENDIKKYKSALSHRQARIRKYELYPQRFKGKVLSPDTHKNIQSINEDIKAGAEYTLPERIIGSIWERFTNANTFLTNKLWAFKDPLEHYKTLQLYGKEYKPWDDPYGSFIESTMRSMAAQTGPAGGLYKWALPLYVIGGNIAAVAGGALGAAYGTINGLIRGATDTAYIPDVIKDRRDIELFFDQAKYERNRRMAELSEGLTREEYLKAMNSTLTAFNENGQDIANLFRGTAYMEKPYIEAWLNTKNDKERREILKFVPKELGQALKRQWSKNDTKDDNIIYNAASSADLAAGSPRMAFNRSILDPSVNLEDIKLKTIEEAGYNAHDFGLGWNQQMYRLLDDYNSIQAANIYESTPIDTPNISPGQVRQAIMEVLRSKGLQGSAQVYINNGANDLNSVNITIRKDRSLTIYRALDNRNKYYA